MKPEHADYAKLLERLANKVYPVAGAEAAAAHTRRGYGFPCPDELGVVWSALDDWQRAGAVIPDRLPLPGTRTPYTGVVTALTVFIMAVERSMGLRR